MTPFEFWLVPVVVVGFGFGVWILTYLAERNGKKEE